MGAVLAHSVGMVGAAALIGIVKGEGDLIAEIEGIGSQLRHELRHASRVLFIKDGRVFHQLYRGGHSDLELYQSISDTLTMLATGGEMA